MAEQSPIKALQEGISSSARDSLVKLLPSIFQQQLNNAHQKALQDDRINAQKNQNRITQENKLIDGIFKLSDDPEQQSNYMKAVIPQLQTEEGIAYANGLLPGITGQSNIQKELNELRRKYEAETNIEKRTTLRNQMNEVALSSTFLSNQQKNYIATDERTRSNARMGVINMLNVNGLLDEVVRDPDFQNVLNNPAISMPNVIGALTFNVQNKMRDKISPSDLPTVISNLQSYRQTVGVMLPEEEQASLDKQIMFFAKTLSDMLAEQTKGVKERKKTGSPKSGNIEFSKENFKENSPVLFDVITKTRMMQTGNDSISYGGIEDFIKIFDIGTEEQLDDLLKTIGVSSDLKETLKQEAKKFNETFIEKTVLEGPQNEQGLSEPTETVSPLTTPDSTLVTPDSLTTTQGDSLNQTDVPLDSTSNEIEENFQDPTQAGFDAMTEQGKEQIEAISEVVGDIADATNIINTPEYLKSLEDGKRLIKTGQFDGRGVSAFSTNIALLVLNGMQQVAKSLEPGEKLSNFNLKNFISQILGQR